MVAPLSLVVESTRGSAGESAPARFALGGTVLQVCEILDRWLAAETHYFKLRAEDGAIYILRHRVAEARWELLLFDSGSCAETRLSST